MKPAIMSTGEWLAATDLGSKWRLFHQDRKKLIPIDRALAEFHATCRGGDPGVFADRAVCMGILNACNEWLRLKGSKISDNAVMRKQAVNKLVKQVMRRLNFIQNPSAAWSQYYDQKARGTRPAADLKKLEEAFKYEGSELGRAKGEPRIGATMIGNALNMAPSLNDANARKIDEEMRVIIPDLNIRDELKDLTPQEYQRLEELLMKWRGVDLKAKDGSVALAIREINYYSKDDRIRLMLAPRDGKFYRIDLLFSTATAKNGKLIYAVDHYGNFYVAEGQGGITNHSSFLHGKPVLCAGEIKAHNGLPTYLSNGSGHYRPTTQHLRNAVMQLRDYAIPLSQMQVVDLFAKQQYRTGDDFLANHGGQALP